MIGFKKNPRQNGFTLVEMMIVVLIIAILVSIAMPAYMEQKRRAEYRSMINQVRTLVVAVRSYCHTALGMNPTAACTVPTLSTSDSNAQYGVHLQTGKYFNFSVRVDPASGRSFRVGVMYNPLGSGNPSLANYTFDANGTRIACAGACM